MRIYIAAALVMCSSPSWAQSVYKCGNTYSQTPCAADSKPLDTPALKAAKPTPPPSDDKISLNIELCKKVLKIKLKDPDSAVFKDARRLGPTQGMSFATGAKFPAIAYSVDVNAKNSYGGFTGYKLGTCFFDLGEENIKSYHIFE